MRKCTTAAALILAAYAVGEAGCLAIRALMWAMAVPIALIAGAPAPTL